MNQFIYWAIAFPDLRWRADCRTNFSKIRKNEKTCDKKLILIESIYILGYYISRLTLRADCRTNFLKIRKNEKNMRHHANSDWINLYIRLLHYQIYVTRRLSHKFHKNKAKCNKKASISEVWLKQKIYKHSTWTDLF